MLKLHFYDKLTATENAMKRQNMKCRASFIAIVIVCLVMSSSVSAQQEDTVPQAAAEGSWGATILHARLLNILPNLGKPDDCRWLVMWVALSHASGTPSNKIPVDKIIVIDDKSEKYVAMGIDCELPIGDLPAFVIFSNMKHQGTLGRYQGRGVWTDIYINSEGGQYSCPACFYEGKPKKFILYVDKGQKAGEVAVCIQKEETLKKKAPVNLVLLFMVMRQANSFNLQIGDGPNVPVSLSGNP